MASSGSPPAFFSSPSSAPLVAIFGSGGGGAEDLARARAVGEALAKAGYGVINGGYGGTMAAAAAAAREAGGHTIGVTCSLFTFRSGPNPYCAEVIEAPTLAARLEEMITRAAAYVVLPGGNGTLAELSLAWEHQRKELLPVRPLVAWEEPWRRIVRVLEEGPYLGGGGSDLISWVSDAESAVAAVRAGVPGR